MAHIFTREVLEYFIASSRLILLIKDGALETRAVQQGKRIIERKSIKCSCITGILLESKVVKIGSYGKW